MHVGLAAYSFRDQFAWMKGKARKVAGEKMDMFSFVDYCADHGCHGAELTSYFFPADADAAYYHRLKRHAFLRGVEVCGTAIGNDFSRGKSKKLDDEVSAAKGWLDKAVQMGAPHVRFRSEEHTSELQSRTNLVCRLLLEKKKIKKKKKHPKIHLDKPT